MSSRGTRGSRTAAPATGAPPYNLEAEQGVLGSMLLDRDAIARVVEEGLGPEDFYRGAHRVVFAAVLELFERGEPVDLITITNRLSAARKLDDVGGATYLASLPDVVPVTANVGAYAGIVREYARRRALLRAGQQLQQAALDGKGTAEAIADAEQIFAQLTAHAHVAEGAAAGSAPALADLLDQAAAFLRWFVTFQSPHQVMACALWVVHTHAFNQFEVSPFLHVSSPERRSGKTRLLEVLELLVRSPWRIVSPSAAVLFRRIHADHPTLLLDEMDAIFGRGRDDLHEPLRALLNAGNRQGVKIPRCVGEGKEIRLVEFDVFTPRVLAGIGGLPDTVEDRSIPIRLQRQAPAEPAEPFHFREARRDAAPIREGLAAWAAGAAGTLQAARPEIPTALHDRAAELWEPLLGIADFAGGEWPRRAREAAVALHADGAAQEETASVQLLAAIREAMYGQGRISTEALVRSLNERDDLMLPEWWARAIQDDTRSTGRWLSRRLRPFGIEPAKWGSGADSTRGYRREAFVDAWARYVPPAPPPPGNGPLHAAHAVAQTGQGVADDSLHAAPDAAEGLTPHRKLLSDKARDMCGVYTPVSGEEGRETARPEAPRPVAPRRLSPASRTYPAFVCSGCGWAGPESRVTHTAGGERCPRCDAPAKEGFVATVYGRRLTVLRRLPDGPARRTFKDPAAARAVLDRVAVPRGLPPRWPA